MPPLPEQRPVGDAKSVAGRLPIEFANTLCAVRGEIRDLIGTPERLRGWLAGRSELGLGEVTPRVSQKDLRAFLGLRTAIRDLFRAVVDDAAPPVPKIDLVNHLASSAPRWPTLRASDGHYSVVETLEGDGIRRALATIAQNTIVLVGAPNCGGLQACPAPGCVLFFAKDHPRRQFCSTACGNRTRAARHYLRHRDG